MRLKRIGLAGGVMLALVASLTGTPPATAKCMSAGNTFVNLPGVDAPLSGETYLLVARGDVEPNGIRASQAGAPVAIEVTREAGGPEYKVLRVSWRGLSPGVLTLEAQPAKKKPYFGTVSTTLNLRADWKSVSARDLRSIRWVGSPKSEVSQWTCSHSQVQLFPLGVKAFAYRVTFNTGDGPRTQIFPPNIYRFFGDDDHKPILPLGHVSCFGETFAHPTAQTFDIEALALDGTVITSAHGIDITRPRSPMIR